MNPIPQEVIGKRLETVLVRESQNGRPPRAQLSTRAPALNSGVTAKSILQAVWVRTTRPFA